MLTKDGVSPLQNGSGMVCNEILRIVNRSGAFEVKEHVFHAGSFRHVLLIAGTDSFHQFFSWIRGLVRVEKYALAC